MSDGRRPLYRRRFESAAAESAAMSLHEISIRASRLNTIARVRTWAQGPAYLIAMCAFGTLMLTNRSAPDRISACVIAIGWGYMLYQVIWSRRRVRGQLATEAETREYVAGYRAWLERALGYLRRTSLCHPLVLSGMVAMIFVTLIRTPTSGRMSIPFIVMPAAIWVLFVLCHVRRYLERAGRLRGELESVSAGPANNGTPAR